MEERAGGGGRGDGVRVNGIRELCVCETVLLDTNKDVNIRQNQPRWMNSKPP